MYIYVINVNSTGRTLPRKVYEILKHAVRFSPAYEMESYRI